MEKCLLEFVMKISLLLTKDNYIICNTFLLVGNLYMKLGALKKAHFFYEKIINKNQHGMPKDNQMCKVIISANYNLGLIYYVTGKYETAKLRMENALEIKKIILKNNYDLELIQIYETLAEIDVQYKNYTSAFIYIQEGSKLLNNKIGLNLEDNNTHRTNPKKSSLKNIIEKTNENEILDSSASFHHIEGNKRDLKIESTKETQSLSKQEIILNKKFNILKNYIGSKLSETLLFTKYDNLDEQKNSGNNNMGSIFNYIQMRNSNMNKRKERADDAEDRTFIPHKRETKTPCRLPPCTRMYVLHRQQQPHVPCIRTAQRRRFAQGSRDKRKEILRYKTDEEDRHACAPGIQQRLQQGRQAICHRLHLVSVVWRRLATLRQEENGNL
jgi:tetratricopeptide (TPR) repeat protein